jgi:hypothetical protein
MNKAYTVEVISEDDSEQFYTTDISLQSKVLRLLRNLEPGDALVVNCVDA